MAQWFNDFSDETVSAFPSFFTSRWAAFGAASGVVEETFPAGEAADVMGVKQFLPEKGVDFAFSGAEITSIAGTGDDEIYIPMVLDVNASVILLGILRGAGSSGSETGYLLYIRPGSGSYQIRRISGGSESVLASGSITGYIDGTVLYHRFSCEPDGANARIRATFWVEGDTEPVTATLDVTDTSPLATGWIGFGDRLATTDPQYIGAIGVGTNGDPAPTAPVGGGAVTGSGSPQAQTATTSGTGERVVTGSGTPTAQTATASGTGSATGTVTGSGAVQAQTATASGTGERVVSGSGTPQANTATTTGTGERTITGSGSPQATRATATGIGLRVITGSGSTSAQAATATGTGSVSGAVSGTGSVNAQPATVSGTGARIVTGSGTAQAPGATASGTGQVAGAVSGTGAVQAQRATATGVGLRVITGQGTGQAQQATASGTGSVQGAITGTGTAQAQRATATGVGLRVITGTGSVQAQAATVKGSDRGALARPVIKPGTVDISPAYASAEIETEYGSLDISPKYGTTDY